jgi:mannose-1-phosphate guanylyltransferase/phosphomannomutase
MERPRAVIMAGGAGSRLRPLTSNQPKPMVPLANRPLMEHIVLLLKRHGITDIVVTVQFLASMVRQYFGDGADLGVSLTYATEETPLGTAGSVKNAEEALRGDEPLLVVSGDALTDVDLEAALAFHREREALVTIVLHREPNPLEYGIVVTDADGRIERFLEKPGWGQVFTDTVNTGIYVLDPRVFDEIPADRPYDFSKELFPKLLRRGEPLYGFVAGGYWCDVGTIEAYRAALADALDGKVAIDLPGFEIADGIRVGDGVEIDPGARLDPPVLIGDHVRIGPGAQLRDHTIIGSNVQIGDGAFLARSCISDNAHIGEHTEIRGALIGRGSDVRDRARVGDGCVVGDGAIVGAGAVLHPDVKIYPQKRVQAGAEVSRSIIWESIGARTLFGKHGVAGLINVDIGPETGVRLGAAFASMLKPGSLVVTARDSSRAARAIKRAIIAGLNGAGVDVEDLEVAPRPLLRHHVRSSRADGGIVVSCVPGDPRSLAVRFIDEDGNDLPEGRQRDIDRIYFREDARRAFAEEIGELRYPPRALEFYQSSLLHRIDTERIRRSALKTVIDVAFGPAAFVLPGLAGRFGADTLLRNAAIDERRPTLTAIEERQLLAALADLVRASRADIGILLEPTAESLRIVAEGGILLDLQQQALLFAALVGEATPGAVIAAPVTVTRTLEDVVAARGGKVVRTPRNAAATLQLAREAGATLALADGGGAAFLEYTDGVDAIAAIVALHELLAAAGGGIADRIAALPHPIVSRRRIPTAWDRKGAVMRAAAEHFRGRDTEDLDGLGVFLEDAWLLIAPDPDEPETELWVEGSDERRAEQLLTEAAAVVTLHG